MSWKDLFFNTTKPVEFKIQQEPSVQTFTTPLMNVPKGDLTKPFVDPSRNANGYVQFGMYGWDNLFPQLLNQLTVQSPLHGSILTFKKNAIVGGGYSIELLSNKADNKIDFYRFEQINHLKRLTREACDDLLVHSRIHILRTIDKNGIERFNRIAPDEIRISKDRTKLYWSNDWSRSQTMKIYPAYYIGCNEDSIISYYAESRGGFPYAYPTYMGSLNWIFLSAEIPSLEKDNIQNSIFPSYAIIVPNKPTSTEVAELLKNNLETLKQSGHRGKSIVLFGDNGLVPTVQALPTNDLPKAFIELQKDISEQISISHNINPGVIGIRVAGSLGNVQELELSYKIFEKNVVLPTRLELEDFLNEILLIAGIPATITFNNNQIIGETIVKVENNDKQLIK